ncbi:NAD(FAD)-utilizing dehydrogenase [Pelagibacterium halotolerans B2]|uniref:NAD(FAD)-utilizing dehydrogenase n=1 Tax=Pelagibacterium halotolerans (strain DSM 22347 / JCM 15775 / CGMCC 1.7692 / B2) TaxID=1082931 RepID=G4RB87_PELHB|nr:TIGR03862 family flavoprotein [Pelagibacterium halotolerans]AEQ51585.1 NAD(FAD)-utilizing dehydrogenase [Pelagibacterium halotolerans B2]
MDKHIAIVGGGPAGLMAAEVISGAGYPVTIYEGMPTVGRKLLMAGKSGLNLTHAEVMGDFFSRFGAARERLEPVLSAFDNEAVRSWAAGLGSETFVGSSGRVFPQAMKASPLLRAWLERLAEHRVAIRTRHRWAGFEGDTLVFETPEGEVRDTFDAVVLALGGASWPKLGSDAAWVAWLEALGVSVIPFRPANCGFDVDWSAHFIERFAGAPVKAVAVGANRGEFVVSRHGVEGSLVYGQSAALRDGLEAGPTALVPDLAPDRSAKRLERDLARQPAKASFSSRLRKGAGLDGVKAGLVRELTSEAVRADPAALVGAIKALAVPLIRTRPIDEAISVAGGVGWDEVDARLMLKKLPGVFVAGEMLDWEAPTGGYLLSACLATGRVAGQGLLDHLRA